MSHLKEWLPNGRILEIGAGGGRDAMELLKIGYDYLGTDISDGLLKHARKKNPNTNFEKVSVYDLNYEMLFDGFWCSAVLLHIPRNKINNALQAINRNMRRGAYGFISVKEGEGEKLERTKSSGRLFVYWTNDDFLKRLTDNGYEIVAQGYRPVSERTKWLTYIVKVGNNVSNQPAR